MTMCFFYLSFSRARTSRVFLYWAFGHDWIALYLRGYMRAAVGFNAYVRVSWCMCASVVMVWMVWMVMCGHKSECIGGFLTNGNVASNRSLSHRLKTAISHNDGSGFYNKRLYECHSQLSHIQVFIIWYILALAPDKIPNFHRHQTFIYKTLKLFHWNYVNFQAH